MKTGVYIFLLACYTAIVASVSAWYFQGDPKVVMKNSGSYNVITRDISKMTVPEKDAEIGQFYRAPFLLDIKPIKKYQYNYRITGRLHTRDGHRDIMIKCGQSGNWKFYAGLASIGAVIGGLIVYKFRP